MQERIVIIEARLSELERMKVEFADIKESIMDMKMVDNNIYHKLETINDAVNSHKDNFIQHDEKEMEKYGSIDDRLKKIERIMYMGIGAGILIELLSKLHLLNIG
jgi:hypothetical protein